MSRQADRVFAAVIVIMYTVGIAGHLVPAGRGLMVLLTPVVLAALGLLVLAVALRRAPGEQRPRLAAWAVVTYAATFAVEALGVATGAIFGAYHYGSVLGPGLAGVPLVIGFNWVLVVLGAGRIAQLAAAARKGTAPLVPLAAGALTVAFDWVMEPVAMRLGYWTWAGNAIPAQNYVAWFLVATAASMALTRVAPAAKGLLPPLYFVVQLVFFAVLRAAV